MIKKTKTNTTPEEPMAEQKSLPKEEPEEILLEGGRIIIAGMTVHARVLDEGSSQKVDFWYGPPVEGVKIPDYVQEYHDLFKTICENTVVAIPDREWGRFCQMMYADKSKDRCLYRIIVTVAMDDQEFSSRKVTDHIDPTFLRADSRVAFRAKQARVLVSRGFEENKTEK